MKFKINKTLLFYIFLLIPLIKPPYFEFINILDILYQFLFIISGIIILYMCFRKKCISKFSILVFIFALVLSISTFLNKELSLSFVKNNVEIILISLLINYGSKYHCKDFLKALIILTSILIWSNFITIIMFPNGMYTNEISHMTSNFLLGIDNIHILYYIYLWLSYCIYVNVYHEKSKLCTLTILISILCLLIRWSATSLVGAFIIAFYFVFSKFFTKIKILNIITYTITYILSFIGIVFLKIQKKLSFIIVNILKKDVTFTKRTQIWKTTIDFIKEKPIMGYGLINYEKRNLTIGVTHAHNLFLEILFQGGFLLLLSFGLLIGSVLKNLHKNYSYDLSKKIVIFIFAFLFMSITEFYSTGYVIFILGLCNAIENYIKEMKINNGGVINEF